MVSLCFLVIGGCWVIPQAHQNVIQLFQYPPRIDGRCNKSLIHVESQSGFLSVSSTDRCVIQGVGMLARHPTPFDKEEVRLLF